MTCRHRLRSEHLGVAAPIPRAPVRLRPLQHLLVPACGRPRTGKTVPRTVLLPRPPRRLQVPVCSGRGALTSSHGQLCARAHCSTARCPPAAAPPHVITFHGQPPCSRAHRNTARCPPSATHAQIQSARHGQPCARAHTNNGQVPSLRGEHTRQQLDRGEEVLNLEKHPGGATRARQRGAPHHRVQALGSGRYCSPRRPTHFEPSSLEL